MESRPAEPHAVTSEAALAALYREPSALVREKVAERMGDETRRFVARSPFALLATVGPNGPHGTPRAAAPGFVDAPDDRTLVLPDRRGNNRLDALRDILHDARVALLLLVPGAGETLRVHGGAQITTDPALRARHAADGREPATLLVIEVKTLFMQRAKAFIRSRLWERRAKPPGTPTLGRLIAEHSAGAHGGAALDAQMPAIYRERLY